MATVLVIDDSKIDQRLAASLLERAGYAVLTASDGAEAVKGLSGQPPDAIVTDLQMPGMDGLALVEAVRDAHPGLPVILMTAFGSEDIAAEALRLGAASYVPKRNLAKDLAETIRRIIALTGASRPGPAALRGISWDVSYRFDLDNDSSRIPTLITHLQADVSALQGCDETELMRIGVALDEALSNAMHHGNLGVSSDLREDGLDTYFAAIEKRRREPPYGDRRVVVTATISAAEARVIIRDQGEGFDPASLPDPTDPANLAKPSGRGLLLIQAFMDEVTHQAGGTQITLVKRCSGAARRV